MELKDIENRHLGSAAFILGAGPSLRGIDISPLYNYVTITVNSGIMKMPDCDYFVSDDQGVREWSYYLHTAKNSKCKKLLYKNKLSNAVSHFRKEDVIFFSHKTWYDPIEKKKYPKGLELTKEANKPIIGARTSMATAVHLAYIMGCNPIVLMGCDCCYEEKNRYFWQFPGENKPVKIGSRPVLDTSLTKIEEKIVDNHCIDFNEYWGEFAKANKGKVDIIDTATEGLLKVFPKMSFCDVINKYADRVK